MIAIMPGGEPDGDEDSLNREHGNGGDSVAHRRIRSLVDLLHREGPMGARKIRLYSDALVHLIDAHNHRDPHGFAEAADECVDALHEILQSHDERGSK
jgi:hypothetical protein